MAVIATLSKGYDLDYIWRQVDRGPARDAASYYIQAAESGGEPPGRWWGPGARALGLQPGQVVDRKPYDLMECARQDSLNAYVVLSLMTGVRTEEARALRWSHVVAWVPEAGEWRPATEMDFRGDKYAVYVWRSVREDGDTKTEESRRTLEIPGDVATAIREHHARQTAQRLEAGQAGTTTISSSAQASAPRSTLPTSAAHSAASPRQPA